MADISVTTARKPPPAADPVDPAAIRTGPRIGITKAVDFPFRFWLAGDRYVSGSRGNGLRPGPGTPPQIVQLAVHRTDPPVRP